MKDVISDNTLKKRKVISDIDSEGAISRGKTIIEEKRKRMSLWGNTFGNKKIATGFHFKIKPNYSTNNLFLENKNNWRLPFRKIDSTRRPKKLAFRKKIKVCHFGDKSSERLHFRKGDQTKCHIEEYRTQHKALQKLQIQGCHKNTKSCDFIGIVISENKTEQGHYCVKGR